MLNHFVGYPILPEEPVIDVIRTFNETNAYTGFHPECSFLNITDRTDTVFEVDWLLNGAALKKNADIEYTNGKWISVLTEEELSDAVLVKEVSKNLCRCSFSLFYVNI